MGEYTSIEGVTPMMSSNSTDNTSVNIPCNYASDNLWYICISLLNNAAAVHVDRYVTPIWYVIGLIGNILTIRIWSYRRMKRVNNLIYLIVLAVTDLMCLFLHMFVELKYAWGISTLDAPVWCPTFFVLFMFAQYMSPLLVFGFTMERFISIVRPFKSERFSRYRRVPLEIVIIAAFALAMASPQAHGWVYDSEIYMECVGSNTTFFAIWSWISEMFIFGLFPITTFVLNILVLRAVSKASRQRRNTLCSVTSRSPGKRTATKLAPSTFTLVCISFYRIFTTLPAAILYPLQFTYDYGDLSMSPLRMSEDPQWQRYFTWVKLKKIIDEIGMSQYSCNIFIYLLTARHFRYEFFRMLNGILPCFKLITKYPLLRRRSTYMTSNGSTSHVRIGNNSHVQGTDV